MMDADTMILIDFFPYFSGADFSDFTFYLLKR